MGGFAETEFGQEASVEPQVRKRAGPNSVWTKRSGVGKASLAEATSGRSSRRRGGRTPRRFGQGKAARRLEATGGRFQPAIRTRELRAPR